LADPETRHSIVKLVSILGAVAASAGMAEQGLLPFVSPIRASKLRRRAGMTRHGFNGDAS
jgi:hypothetical protein